MVALNTCHKIFKKYRYSFRSDELWTEIKIVVDNLFTVYYSVANEIYHCLQSATNDADLKVHIESFIPLLKVFISLNGQDIPQQFDDTIKD